ncbi:MAG: hypothetical protein JNL97_17420, partial [Verrucomicrobiales bacterium]|nr:hypothetical protein [Verrucomicrobiales bacterium]
MLRTPHALVVFALACTALAVGPSALAQPRGNPPPLVVSPEVSADRHVTLRILAPKAQSVQIGGGDIPGTGFGSSKPLVAGTNGVWEVKLGPLPPGSYRYAFNVDGVTIMDPRNPKTSESNDNSWSLVHVPGAEGMDVRDVPHGAVSEVTYWSSTLKRFRRLHVYTPPGYETDAARYPVF